MTQVDTEQPAPEEAKPRRQRTKGGFAVLRHVEADHWEVVATDFPDVSAVDRYVRSKGESLAGAELMFVQVKKVSTVKVETVKKVTF